MSDLDQAGKNYLRLKDRVKKMQAELDDIREFFVETIGSGASAATASCFVSVSEYEIETLDAKKLKAELPDLHRKYASTSTRIRLTVEKK